MNKQLDLIPVTVVNELLAAGFYVSEAGEFYIDFERVRPGLDRLEVVTYDTTAKHWYGVARAIDLFGNDVCPEVVTKATSFADGVVMAFDALPPEFAYHNHDATPGALIVKTEETFGELGKIGDLAPALAKSLDIPDVTAIDALWYAEKRIWGSMGSPDAAYLENEFNEVHALMVSAMEAAK